MKRQWLLARALDKGEAGSYIFERFVYRSLGKVPERLQDAAVKTVGMAAKNTGRVVRAVINKAWQRWG